MASIRRPSPRRERPLAALAALAATPALAVPPDLPFAFGDDARLYALIGSGVLLFAALVLRAIRHPRADSDADAAAPERAYGMRFFRSDRPIALE